MNKNLLRVIILVLLAFIGRAEAIRLALRELGYIEGQNIAFEYRYAEGKVDRAP